MAELSVRPSGRWGGLCDASTSQPTVGMFSRLVGCYPSKDGTELRRWPGSTIGAQPFLGQPYEITGGTKGTTTIIETSNSHYARELGATGDLVYVAGNADVDDGVYLSDRNANDEIEILLNTGSAAALATDGVIWVDREETVHGLYCVEGRPVIVAETRVYTSNGTVEHLNIGAWVGSRLLDVGDPEGPGFSAVPDVGFQFYRSPTMLPFSSVEDDTDIWSMTVKGRIQGDVLNGRLCLAVPGHGHLWQVDVARSRFPLRYPEEEVPDHRVIKALGIPKGLIQTVQAIAAGQGFIPPNSVVWLAVGYMDPVTGEVGRPSRAVRVTTGDSAPSYIIQVTAHMPRNVLLETHGLATVVYAAFGDELDQPPLLPRFAFYELVAGQPHNRPNPRPPEDDWPRTITLRLLTLPDEDDAQPIAAPGFFPELEQMPVGGTVCRVAKARLASAGDHGLSDEHTVQLAVRTQVGSGNFAETEYYICPSDSDVSGAVPIESRAAHYRLPSGYEGHLFTIKDGAVDNALTTGRLEEKLNPRIPEHKEAYLFDQVVPPGPLTNKDGYLHLMPHLMSFSEEAATGASPAINRLPIDRLRGLRPWGIGRVGDSWIVCTDKETFYLAWGSYPRAVSALTISNEYGCIAPCSMVEGPFGLAWLSADGPVGYGRGGVVWIGREIRELWATLQRDSLGRMWHAQGMYDPERELVLWTLRGPDDESSAWVNATTDADRSKVPGDLVLWWHPATGAFGTHAANRGREVAGLAAFPQVDHTWKACFITPRTDAGLRPIYVTSDTYADRSASVLTYAATADRPAGFATFTGASTANSAIAAGDDAFARAPDGTLRWWGRILSTTANGFNLTPSDGAVWKNGDTLVARCIHMGLTTLRMPPTRKVREDVKVRGVNLRYEIKSGSYAYARVRVTGSGSTVNLCHNVWGDRITGTQHTFSNGSVQGTEFELEVDIISDGQVVLKDASWETQ